MANSAVTLPERIPPIDFETFSTAGYVYHPETGAWKCIGRTGQNGIQAVGAPVYSEHPSTEVLCLAYDLLDGNGPALWVPDAPRPERLFEHVKRGGLVEAWNSIFEYLIWNNVGVRRYGFPPLPLGQMRDAMAKSAAYSGPQKLEKAGPVYGVEDEKIADGKRLIRKFCVPRKHTKKDSRDRVPPVSDPADAARLYRYCIGDIKTQHQISQRIPDMPPRELELWKLDQRINTRGVFIDAELLDACLAVVNSATEKYTAELREITNGAVGTVNELDSMKVWLRDRNVMSGNSLDKAMLETLLDAPHVQGEARRVLEIRQILGSANVKKIHAIKRQTSADGRLRDLYRFCGADRTGRFSGMGPQPQNLYAGGLTVDRCGVCNRYHARRETPVCPRCGGISSRPAPWSIEAVEDVIDTIQTRDLETVERRFGDPITAVTAVLRGLFIAPPGMELIDSDFSAIEAVVLAELAGEQWRREVFRGHGMIYEMSASKITGVPFEEFIAHRERTGEHHPYRKTIGKVAELASGYQGAVGAWIAFGADEHFDSEEEILANVRKWRAANPAIVSYWYALEDAARNAITYPGERFTVRDYVSYRSDGRMLYCDLPSGRSLHYHTPILVDDVTPWGKPVKKITYMGWNTDPKKGSMGWMRFDTYGGKLTENVVQAVSRDILANSMLNIDRAGIQIVLHTHDQITGEVWPGQITIEQYEALMSEMPSWAADWPVRASGGWMGKRYRKD